MTTKSIPFWMTESIRRTGGEIDGKPAYRIMWGADRLELMDEGMVNPYISADGSTFSQGYSRWHLEKLHEGNYEHVYQFGYCPHVTAEKRAWCNSCTLSGGDFLDVTTSYAVVERIINLFKLTEAKKHDAIAQRDALMGREQAKKGAGNQRIRDAVRDAAPITVPRSFNPSLKRTADSALGRSKMRVMRDEEIKH